MQQTSSTQQQDCGSSNGMAMGPKLRHTLSVVERQNELKTKAKRTLQRLDEGNIYSNSFGIPK
jgi:hypothetical protein